MPSVRSSTRLAHAPFTAILKQQPNHSKMTILGKLVDAASDAKSGIPRCVGIIYVLQYLLDNRDVWLDRPELQMTILTKCAEYRQVCRLETPTVDESIVSSIVNLSSMLFTTIGLYAA